MIKYIGKSHFEKYFSGLRRDFGGILEGSNQKWIGIIEALKIEVFID